MSKKQVTATNSASLEHDVAYWQTKVNLSYNINSR